MSDRGAAGSVPSVRVATKAGRVSVVAEDRDDVSVEGRARVREESGRTTIDGGPDRVTVRVPVGTGLVVGTASGGVEVTGRLGTVAITTESGRVSIEHAASLDVRTTSARVEVGRVDGCVRARNRSGRVSVGRAGEADIATTSGRIELVSVAGPAVAHCVSGRIEIGLEEAADVTAETVSGRIQVRLPAGARAHLVDGSTPAGPRPAECDCTVVTRSVSGRVTVEQG